MYDQLNRENKIWHIEVFIVHPLCFQFQNFQNELLIGIHNDAMLCNINTENANKVVWVVILMTSFLETFTVVSNLMKDESQDDKISLWVMV